MWGKIMIPMYRLWLHGLYGLYGPRRPLSPERLLNLITHSLSEFCLTCGYVCSLLLDSGWGSHGCICCCQWLYEAVIAFPLQLIQIISMAQCKTAVTPFLTHWSYCSFALSHHRCFPDSKFHGACMEPTWGRQDPGGPHVNPTNLATRIEDDVR